jgi:hypothetical protein
MSRAFAISMTRPHETLGLPQPLGRRLPQGVWAWNLTVLLLSIALGIMYIFQVNAATAKSYHLRDEERRVEALKTETMVLQDKIVTLSSLEAVSTRASQLGFAPVDNLQFVNPASKSYAMAR